VCPWPFDFRNVGKAIYHGPFSLYVHDLLNITLSVPDSHSDIHSITIPKIILELLSIHFGSDPLNYDDLDMINKLSPNAYLHWISTSLVNFTMLIPPPMSTLVPTFLYKESQLLENSFQKIALRGHSAMLKLHAHLIKKSLNSSICFSRYAAFLNGTALVENVSEMMHQPSVRVSLRLNADQIFYDQQNAHVQERSLPRAITSQTLFQKFPYEITERILFFVLCDLFSCDCTNGHLGPSRGTDAIIVPDEVRLDPHDPTDLIFIRLYIRPFETLKQQDYSRSLPYQKITAMNNPIVHPCHFDIYSNPLSSLSQTNSPLIQWTKFVSKHKGFYYSRSLVEDPERCKNRNASPGVSIYTLRDPEFFPNPDIGTFDLSELSEELDPLLQALDYDQISSPSASPTHLLPQEDGNDIPPSHLMRFWNSSP